MAKRIGADLLDFAVPEIAEVVSGRKNFKTAAKSVGKQTLRKQLGEGSRNKESFQQSVAMRHFYKHFSLIMSNNFRYQPFVAVSGNLEGKVPIFDHVLSSHEQEIYPTTSLDENCKGLEVQTDRTIMLI